MTLRLAQGELLKSSLKLPLAADTSHLDTLNLTLETLFMSAWEHIYRLTWILIVAVIVVGIVCVFLPQYAKYRELQHKRERTEDEIQREDSQHKHFQQQREKLRSDPEFVEEIARSEGMIKTNEVLFRMDAESR